VIGVFDSGYGGLTVLAALHARLQRQRFLYLGDNAHAPYGPRTGAEIQALTQAGVEVLFRAGARVVISPATPRPRRPSDRCSRPGCRPTIPIAGSSASLPR